MQEIAFGEIGMPNDEFWNSTPKEFHYRQKGYFAKLERIDRNEWERIRWQTTALLNIHSSKDLKPIDIAVFPWEKEKVEAEKEKNKIDPKKLARMVKAMDNHAKEPTKNNQPVKIGELLNQ